MYVISTYAGVAMPIVIHRKKTEPLKPAAKQQAEEQKNASEQAGNLGAKQGGMENSEAERLAIAGARIRSELGRARNRHAGQRELKSRRRELRLTPSADDLITCAMEVSGLTAGDLAYEGARKVLEIHNQRLRMQRNRSHRR